MKLSDTLRRSSNVEDRRSIWGELKHSIRKKKKKEVTKEEKAMTRKKLGISAIPLEEAIEAYKVEERERLKLLNSFMIKDGEFVNYNTPLSTILRGVAIR